MGPRLGWGPQCHTEDVSATLVSVLVALVGGYAVGTLPVAWLLVRRRHGVDLRAEPVGTGAVGALRAGGVRTAVLSLLLEALKGAFVGTVVRILGGPGWLAALAIAGCVVGDVFPIGVRRGGRGVVPLVSGLAIALPFAGLITGVVAVVSVLFAGGSETTANRVTAVAVPVGLVLGTDSLWALIPAAIIVVTLVVRRSRVATAPALQRRHPITVEVVEPPH